MWQQVFCSPALEKSHLEVTVNRFAKVTTLLSFLLSLVSSGKAFAQFNDDFKPITREWVRLDEGAQVLKLWNKKDLDRHEPEIAILRLEPKQYEKFRLDPTGYIMHYK